VRKLFKPTLLVALATAACLSVFVVPSASAQSLGEIARRERAKKNQPSPAHVYTNDDLQRPQILVPQDRERFEADRKIPASADAPQTAAAPRNVSTPADLPLGDVARYYRFLKELREEQRQAPGKILPGVDLLASPKLTTPELVPALRTTPLPKPPSRRGPFSTRETPAIETTGVRVRRGDSLWKISSQYLGSGARWHELATANPEIENPNLIRVGDWIRLPEQITPGSNSMARVKVGDSLWKLAEVHLGSGAAWTCIAEANPSITNVNLIMVGQTLNIPSHCSPRAELSRLTPTSN
jgi:nucleoid-associated protein YgaU